MGAMRFGLVLLLAAIALAAIPSSAGARSRYCGSYSGNTEIYVLHVTCRTGYHVIRNFAADTERSGAYRCASVRARPLVHKWTCRKRSFVVSWRPPFAPQFPIVRG